MKKWLAVLSCIGCLVLYVAYGAKGALDTEEDSFAALLTKIDHSEPTISFIKQHFDSIEEAAEQGEYLAQYYLHLYYQEIEKPKSFKWLTKSAVGHANAALALSRHYWNTQNYSQSYKWLAHASELGAQQANALLLALLHDTAKPLVTRKQCIMRLQLVTDDWSSFEQGLQIIQTFRQDQRLNDLPICINYPILIDSLHCNNLDSQTRLTCDLQDVETLAKERSFTHAVLLAQQGKANVYNGVMYLDNQDSYSVFIHELAHFVGFVDEYALAPALAALHCQESEKLNIVIGKENNKLGKYPPTSTCANHPNQAFKKSNRLTFMEYHDIYDIPSNYLTMWRDALLDPMSMTPIFVNFMQKSEQNTFYWQNQLNLFQQTPKS